MGISRRLSNTGNWMNGTQGINTANAMFNSHYDDLNRDHYNLNGHDWKADLNRSGIELSSDDDFFEASYWHRYYKICNRKHRLEKEERRLLRDLLDAVEEMK